MAIPPIGAGFTPPVAPPATTTPAPAASSPDQGFGTTLMNALDSVQASQDNADQLSQLAATGQLSNLHDLTIATSEAELTTQLTTAVRDKAVAAFNAIMQMPV